MITKIESIDVRFPLKPGEGSDSVHTIPVYSYAVTRLLTDTNLKGTGLAFTLGEGNDLVCQAIDFMGQELVGQDIEQVMSSFGKLFYTLSNHHQYRWLGPHKGVTHLALASITNACFDLWAKQRQVPLWKLLLDLSPEHVLHLLDLSYVKDVLSEKDILCIQTQNLSQRKQRSEILKTGYPGYDTSVGWFNYPDEQVIENCKRAVDKGFNALKLKVGSDNPDRDVRRAHLVRENVGDKVKVMLDANQKWSLPQAIRICLEFASMTPYWIEEPTHPDDVLAHQTLARAISPIAIALGEHVPNRIVFKNYLQAHAAGFIQVDVVRVGGVSEFLTISLMCKKFGIPVLPHVGDMGQIHQHLVLYNHIAMGHPVHFLEHIPHLQDYFVHPARVRDGHYQTPKEPGSSSDIKIEYMQ